MNSEPTQKLAIGAVAISERPLEGEWGDCRRQSLLALATRGNVSAFNELIRPYEKSLYLVSLAIAGNTESAERIAMEAIYRAFVSLWKLTALEHLAMCLTEMAVFVGRELVGLEHDSFCVEWNFSTDKDPKSLLLDTSSPKTRSKLTWALLHLPQFQRVVIVLRDSLHYSTSQIANILAVSPKNVTKALSSARFGIYQSLASNESNSALNPLARTTSLAS